MARVGVHEDPAYARDTALRRIRLTRGWMIAAAAGLTAGLAAVASALLPGKSLGAKSRSGGATALHTSAARPGLSPALPPPAAASQLGIGSASQQGVSPPASAPQPAPQAAPQSAAPQPAAPQPAAPQPAPEQAAPAPSGGGGGVVSGGS